jgi:hypothetical protein
VCLPLEVWLILDLGASLCLVLSGVKVACPPLPASRQRYIAFQRSSVISVTHCTASLIRSFEVYFAPSGCPFSLGTADRLSMCGESGFAPTVSCDAHPFHALTHGLRVSIFGYKSSASKRNLIVVSSLVRALGKLDCLSGPLLPGNQTQYDALPPGASQPNSSCSIAQRFRSRKSLARPQAILSPCSNASTKRDTFQVSSHSISKPGDPPNETARRHSQPLQYSEAAHR